MTPQLFARLFTASRDAHEGGMHEAACHALTAAMHVANDGADEAGLEKVIREARAQSRWLDEHVPEHPLSSRHPERGDRPGPYAALANQAERFLAETRAGAPRRGR